MAEVKPICVIYFPNQFYEKRDNNWIYEYMRYLNGQQSDGDVKWDERKDYWNQYYWFCFYKDDITEPELQVLNAKDITPIQFEELEKLIKEAIEQIKK